MNLFQRFMNKYFGWKYAMFYGRLGYIEVKKYHELSNGTKYVNQSIFKKVMNKDGSLSMDAIFNCDYVKWENL